MRLHVAVHLLYVEFWRKQNSNDCLAGNGEELYTTFCIYLSCDDDSRVLKFN
jgi:hypothetical protein